MCVFWYRYRYHLGFNLQISGRDPALDVRSIANAFSALGSPSSSCKLQMFQWSCFNQKETFLSFTQKHTKCKENTFLLICDAIACNSFVSLTSLGLIPARICVRSVALHQARHRFRKHQFCLRICAPFFLLAGAQPSLNIVFLLSASVSSSPARRVGSFYSALILCACCEHWCVC